MKHTGKLRFYLPLLLVGILLTTAGCTLTFKDFWRYFTDRERTQEKLENPTPEQSYETPEQNSTNMTEMEERTMDEINEYRRSKNLPVLVGDARIVEQARRHSQNMGNGTVPFSHQGFQERVNSSQIAYRSAAENVAKNLNHPDPVSTAVNGWIQSEGHRKNIEGNFDTTGVGIIKAADGTYYFTQIFILKQ